VSSSFSPTPSIHEYSTDTLFAAGAAGAVDEGSASSSLSSSILLVNGRFLERSRREEDWARDLRLRELVEVTEAVSVRSSGSDLVLFLDLARGDRGEVDAASLSSSFCCWISFIVSFT